MDTVLQVIYENYKGEDREVLVRAYHYAEEAHSGQKRASGEAYFIHPCAVAKILIELGLDSATVAAAFLHDVIEDTPVTEADIRSNFGDEILGLVSGVTKLDKIVFKSREEEEAENFRKIFVAMAKDIRVIIIKLADRLHNMRSLNFLSIERQKKMAQETLDVYTPLAGRLGISALSVRKQPRNSRQEFRKRHFKAAGRALLRGKRTIPRGYGRLEDGQGNGHRLSRLFRTGELFRAARTGGGTHIRPL